MVKEVVEEIATMNVSVRHLIIATVIRRLCWQIPDSCFYTSSLHTQGDTASRTHSILMYVRSYCSCELRSLISQQSIKKHSFLLYLLDHVFRIIGGWLAANHFSIRGMCRSMKLIITRKNEMQRWRIKLPLLTYSDHEVTFTNPKLTKGELT